jgi:hypothetical protein
MSYRIVSKRSSFRYACGCGICSAVGPYKYVSQATLYRHGWTEDMSRKLWDAIASMKDQVMFKVPS